MLHKKLYHRSAGFLLWSYTKKITIQFQAVNLSGKEMSMTMKRRKIEPSCSVVGEGSHQLLLILLYEVGIFIFFSDHEKDHLDVK